MAASQASRSWGATVFGQSLDGYAFLGIGLILAGVMVLNARSTAASG